jgi:superfamily II DNA or RNA helicase
MLGEGFDFPQLKIAAIHAPHKSLAVTLQFIGRFARTNADNLGTAKFLAVPSDIEIEAERLYEERAVWHKLVPNLLQTRVEQELRDREAIATFEPLAPSDGVDLPRQWRGRFEPRAPSGRDVGHSPGDQ